MRSFAVLGALASLVSCTSTPTGFTVFATSSQAPAIRSFLAFVPEAQGEVVVSGHPEGEWTPSNRVGVALLTDRTCGDCYELSGSGWSYQVHAGSLLGLQYGLAELLESFQFRFFHPWAVKAPAKLAAPDKSVLGHLFTPEKTVRAVHLHTIHPIEAHFAFWQPDSGLDDARRINDWIVKNRGNYVEWTGLNDIIRYPDVRAEWRTHTKAILADAHERGLKLGIGIQMFGTSNLQLAFDLLDTQDEPNPRAVVEERLHMVLDELPFDTVNISFGEFSGASPQVFIDSLNMIYDALQTVAPGTQMTATVHLGNAPDLIVDWDGKMLPYYFLVQYANANITPWIHTVMFYDLFQSVGGAYGYDTFNDHRQYLQERMKAGQPVGYYPETAYWVAFDNSVPLYLPVYMRSRWLDQAKLHEAARAGGYADLDRHMVFSSGWEWGYWQQDYATLRMNFHLPSDWQDETKQMFAPWGDVGRKVADQIGALGEVQSQALIDGELASYLAGRDQLIDYGATSGKVAQPLRKVFSEIRTMNAEGLAAFRHDVLTPLTKLQTDTEDIRSAIHALALDPADPWLSEVVDGIEVDAARTRFVRALNEAVVVLAESGSDAGWLAQAEQALAEGRTVVERRHARLHYPGSAYLLSTTPNSTLYQYGYLYEADTLCYWERERLQVRNIVLGETNQIPSCVL